VTAQPLDPTTASDPLYLITAATGTTGGPAARSGQLRFEARL
jgi:hypothetical protein